MNKFARFFREDQLGKIDCYSGVGRYRDLLAHTDDFAAILARFRDKLNNAVDSPGLIGGTDGFHCYAENRPRLRVGRCPYGRGQLCTFACIFDEIGRLRCDARPSNALISLKTGVRLTLTISTIGRR